jgi:Tol biopolymer transport system component
VAFSPNGQRLVYVAQVGKQQVVVVDGQAGKPYKGIAFGSLVFSADSQHVAYGANDEEEDTWFVVLDGQAGKPYEAWVTGPVFSPDSQRLAYAVAVDEAKQTVVLDGLDSKAYNGIKPALLAFSPDSRRLAYGAQGDKGWHVVLDGQEGRVYENLLSLGGGKIVFDAPDRFHYLATSGQDIYIVQEQFK